MTKRCILERTRQLEFGHLPPAPQIMLVLIRLPQSLAILLMLLVMLPMLLRAMRRPTAIRTLELGRLGGARVDGSERELEGAREGRREKGGYPLNAVRKGDGDAEESRCAGF